MKKISLDSNSIVISVDDVRYNRFCQVFTKNNIAVPSVRFGIKHDHHGTGCRLSHIAAVEYAKEHNLEYCIIFEDDAYPCIDCKNAFNTVIEELSNKNIAWDIINLGIYGEHSEYTGNKVFNDSTLTEYDVLNSKNIEFISDTCMKVHKFPHGSASYLIKNSAYDEFLSNLKTKDLTVDFQLGADNFTRNIVLTTKQMLFIQYFHYNNKLFCHYPYFYNKLGIQIGPIQWLSDELPKGFEK